jgi:tetratricopeptide (TPR) repeat protein
MSRDDWFRSTTWDDKIAAQFEAKLKRARRKGQYIRIQACTLAETHPEVALLLLDKYFEQEDRFDEAQAYVDRATALTSLGRADEAVAAYEDALRAEARNPGLLTQAGIELPYLVAVTAQVEQYDRALRVLNKSRERLAFPVEHFKWNAAQALIAGARKQMSEAREFAKRALEAASKDHSGFRYHAKLGLVSKEHADALRRLQTYCDS